MTINLACLGSTIIGLFVLTLSSLTKTRRMTIHSTGIEVQEHMVLLVSKNVQIFEPVDKNTPMFTPKVSPDIYLAKFSLFVSTHFLFISWETFALYLKN